MPGWKKISLITVAVVLGLMLLSMLVIPWQLKKQAHTWFAAHTSRSLSIEKAYFNPFSLTIEIEGLKLSEQQSEQPFVTFKGLRLSGSINSLFELAVILDRVELDEPFVNLELLGQQEFNFSDFSRLEGEKAPPSADPGRPLYFSFNNILLTGGRIDFTDRTAAKKSRHQIRELSLSIPFIGNIPYLADEYVEPQLRLLLNGSEIRANGQLKPFHNSLETSLTLLLEEADLAFYARHSPIPLPLEVKSGVLDAQIDLAYRVSSRAQPKLLLSGELALTDIDLRELDGRELFRMATLILDLDRADLMQQDFNLRALEIYRPQLYLGRDRQGRWNFERIEALLHEEQQPVVTPEEGEASGLPLLKLAQLQLFDGQVHYRDNFTPGGFREELSAITLSLGDLRYPQSAQSPFSLSAKIGPAGTIGLDGTLAHTPLQLAAETRVAAFPLVGVNGFLPQNIRVALKEGELHSDMRVGLNQTPQGLSGSFSGRANVSGFNLRDPLTDGELLTWENLGLEGIKGRLAPFSLQIKEIALSRYLANILIDRDGQINLTSVTADEPEAERESPPPEIEPQVAADEAGPPPDIRIDALTLQGGTVSFTDRHLPNTFTTTMYELGGRITGMASAAEMRADVDLRGQLENHSPLSISGSLNPLSRELFADLKIRFEDIELAPLTPYSGTYLGYVIDKGKLYLELDYQIEHQQIEAANRIMLDQFTFGDKVESDLATALPVSLAIALLKDRQGEIHLDVPVSGNLNDPSFSIAGTVFTVLKNLLIKAATSPFSLLAALVGGEGDDFSQISFGPGVAILSPEARQLLAKLSQMLGERPALRLELSAFVDPEVDPEGYRQAELSQRVDSEWRRRVKPQAAQQMAAAEYPEQLWRVYKQAKFPKPRNALGLQKKLPVAELEKLLLANIRVGDEELQRLARARAATVQQELIARNPDLKPRIFLKTADINTPPEKSNNPARVEFGIATN